MSIEILCLYLPRVYFSTRVCACTIRLRKWLMVAASNDDYEPVAHCVSMSIRTGVHQERRKFGIVD